MLAKVDFIDSLDLRTATYTKHYNDGTEIKADLLEGKESAFAVVKIKDEVITTETPNLTLRLFRNMAPNKKEVHQRQTARAISKARPKKRPRRSPKKKS